MTKDFSNKMYWLRLICSFMIVGVHCANHDILGEEYTISIAAQSAINTYIFYVAVPLFFIMSGFFFYYKLSQEDFLTKWKKRLIHTTFLYLLWNIIYTIYKLVKTNISFLSSLGRNHNVVSINMENLLEGIFLFKYNVPWWFMFQLLILELLAPVIWKALQKKSSTICLAGTVLVLAILSEVGILSVPYVRFYSFVYYLAGVIIAYWAPELLIKCQGEKLLHRLLPIGVIEIMLYICNKYWEDKFSWILYTVLALAVWNIFNSLDIKKECNKNWKISFLIYAIHPFFIGVLYQVEKAIIPINEVTSFLMFLINPVLVVFGVRLLADILKKVKLYRFFTGEFIR